MLRDTISTTIIRVAKSVFKVTVSSPDIITVHVQLDLQNYLLYNENNELAEMYSETSDERGLTAKLFST